MHLTCKGIAELRISSVSEKVHDKTETCKVKRLGFEVAVDVNGSAVKNIRASTVECMFIIAVLSCYQLLPLTSSHMTAGYILCLAFIHTAFATSTRDQPDAGTRVCVDSHGFLHESDGFCAAVGENTKLYALDRPRVTNAELS